MDEDKKKPSVKSLKVQLARQAFKMGTRYQALDAASRLDINTAMNLLTQAMVIADGNESEARRLLDMARRISRLQ